MQDALRKFKAEIFKALGHPTRIAIVEMMREGEVPAAQIFERLPVEQANVSQHLAVLRAKRIVTSRKDGSQVYYTIRDPLLIQVLDVMKMYFEAHVAEALATLNELRMLTSNGDDDRDASPVSRDRLGIKRRAAG